MSTLDAVQYVEYVLAHKTNVLAPWIAGPIVDLYAAGIYTGLVFRYFINLRPGGGNRPITLLVSLVAVLSALKTTAALYILFLNAVVLSGDTLAWAAAAYTNWVMMTEPLTTTLVDLAVQMYYIVLLNKLLRVDSGRLFHPVFRWTLLSLIFSSFAASIAFGVLAMWEMLSRTYRHPALYLTLQLAMSFVGDALISAGTVYCLLKSDASNTAYRSPIRMFARFIVLSAAFPALLALLNFLLVATNVSYNRWQILFDFALSKSFAISLMWTIEVRRKIIAASTGADATTISTRPPLQSQSPGSNIFVSPSMFAATVQIPRSQMLEQENVDLGNGNLTRRVTNSTEPSHCSDWKA